MAKTRMSVEVGSDGTTYEIRSKSLVSAMRRTLLVVGALGEDRVFIEYAVDDTKKKPRHIFFLYA